ncbi:hypothetical protein M573_101068 [Prevotella intermedia ZT]|jgi:hypothetical protein|uniref:DUF4376 domain-containing protein n=1 Tax=Prevotella intermedia ZT TaxID=1347790 RepID=A0AAP0VMU3_PREIN|nr:DUF4376 domain-containing protein [Prevotella intermedia]KJJ88145.1 hypothetical protein M573_101068 [Prevotella intermedia ZT]
MITQYRKGDNIYNGSYIITDTNTTILNPTHDILIKNGYKVEEIQEDTLEQAIAEKIATIKAYDNSDNVNSFLLNGVAVWIDREDRIGTRRAIELDIEAGNEVSEIWLQGMMLKVNSQLALKLLDMVEHYAFTAYNITQRHIHNIKQLTTIEEVNKYDYTQGYPKKLELNT